MTAWGSSKLRWGNKDGNLMLTLPAQMSRALAEAGMTGRLFHAELTSDGILFRLVDDDVVEVPAWMNGEGDG